MGQSADGGKDVSRGQARGKAEEQRKKPCAGRDPGEKMAHDEKQPLALDPLPLRSVLRPEVLNELFVSSAGYGHERCSPLAYAGR